VEQALPLLADGTVVLVSSQLPAGSVGRLQECARNTLAGKTIHFAVSPENLRLGKAIDVFLKPDRIIIGTHGEDTRNRIATMLAPLQAPIEWMSIESAEVTKHAINAFLALSVTFANELASLCELVGADAKEVERGLKSEARIGPKAYLAPGGPFAGGTLARDIVYLESVGEANHLALPLLSAVRPSNDAHKLWIRRKLLQLSPSLAGVPVTIWGLTYKAGTDTLRRSLAVELCDWLIGQGADIHIHDPAVTRWPEAWQDRVVVHEDAMEAAKAARYLVIGTEWPRFQTHMDALAGMRQSGLTILDPNRHLKALCEAFGDAYIAVGMPSPASQRGRP
jgi:UDPglucose 6-dehydrogenase